MNILFTEDNYLSRKIGRYLKSENREFKIVTGTDEVLDNVLNNVLEGHTSGLIFLFDDLSNAKGSELLKKIRSLEAKNNIEVSEANVIVLLTAFEDRHAYLTNKYKACDYVLVIPKDGKKLAMVLEASKRNHYQVFPKSA